MAIIYQFILSKIQNIFLLFSIWYQRETQILHTITLATTNSTLKTLSNYKSNHKKPYRSAASVLIKAISHT